MKKTVGRLFEPLLFAAFIVTAGCMAMSAARRHRYQNLRRKAHTGCGHVKLLRYTSKRAAEEYPLLMPGTLVLGALPGASLYGAGGMLLGAGLMWALFVALPIAAPLPSVVAELEQISR